MLGSIIQTLFPVNRVSLLAADERMKPEMKHQLREWGLELLEVPACNCLQASISGHPDMQIIHIRGNLLVCHPQMPEQFLEKLRKAGFLVYLGKTKLQADYPFDIAYNVAIIGNIAFHNTKYTDPVLVKHLEKCAIRLVHVKQGYTKCSILPVTPDSLVTADPSIAQTAVNQGFDVLHLPPQTNIRLTGLRYGFIGGTAGFINKNLLVFAGSLDALNNAEAVKAFLRKHGVDWVNLSGDEIHDYGGLLPLYE